MKKLTVIIGAIMLAFLSLFSVNLNHKCYADSSQISINEFVTYQQSVLQQFSAFKSRQNGLEGESEAALFIKSTLDEICSENSNIAAENTSSTQNGLQKFSFCSALDNKNYYSQNVIYKYISSSNTNKKVILATNYDNFAMDNSGETTKFIESEGINSSGASVALLLTIAKSLKNCDLPFNVEFIFFGAGESNNAGSNYYVKGISNEEKSNILCMINIDSIAVGKNIYFYVDEVETNFSKFVSDVASKNNVKQISLLHLGKYLLDDNNELGLDYSHIAISSDNISFMSQNITSINIFAGDYENGIVYGRSEFEGEETINYTKNDNLDYIAEKYGANHVSENLYKTYIMLMNLFNNADFENNCMAAQNQTKAFYDFFGNDKLIAYLTVIVLVVMIVIAISVHLNFTLKSYDANIEPEFLSTIISISQNIDETCMDENIPKAVSQVIANDIKKDKTIKLRKKKKNDKED